MVWACDEETEAVGYMVAMKMNVCGNRGRPMKRRMETIESDMRVVNVRVGDVNDRDEWKYRTRGWPTPNSWGERGEDQSRRLTPKIN